MTEQPPVEPNAEEIAQHAQPASERRCIECGGKGYVMEWDEHSEDLTKLPCSTCRPMQPPASEPTIGEQWAVFAASPQPPASEPSGRELPDQQGFWIRHNDGCGDWEVVIRKNDSGLLIAQGWSPSGLQVYGCHLEFLPRGHWHPAAPAGEREEVDELPPFPQPQVVESYVGIPKAKHAELMARLAALESSNAALQAKLDAVTGLVERWNDSPPGCSAYTCADELAAALADK